MHPQDTTPRLCLCGCGEQVTPGRRFRKAHQLRAKESFEVRFWRRVDRSSGPDACWPWLSAIVSDGYGIGKLSGRVFKPHRVAWELINGPLPPDRFACHNCDVRYPPGDMSYRRCCNPAHIWPGTHKENMADCVAKGRTASGDRNASRLRPERLRRSENHPLHQNPMLASRGERHWSRIHPERVLRGESHGRAKLTSADVSAIVHAYGSGRRKADLARQYGVSATHINRVIHGESWRHVT